MEVFSFPSSFSEPLGLPPCRIPVAVIAELKSLPPHPAVVMFLRYAVPDLRALPVEFCCGLSRLCYAEWRTVTLWSMKTSHMALWTWGLLQLVLKPTCGLLVISVFPQRSSWLPLWCLAVVDLSPVPGFLPLASVGLRRSGAFRRYGLLHAAAQRRCRDIARTLGLGWVFAHELHLSGEFVPSSAIEFGSRNALNFCL